MPVPDTERRSAPHSSLHSQSSSINPGRNKPVILRAQRSHSAMQITAVSTEPGHRNPDERHASQYRTIAPVSRQTTLRSFSIRQLHPLFFIGLGLLFTFFLWLSIPPILHWGNDELNTLRYGNPRTFQSDAVVGQGDSRAHPSHFIAINLHGIVTIIDFPAGDASHARILTSLSILGSNPDQVVVTFRFIDINHNGKPDMFITVGDMQSVLVNDGSTFRPPTLSEQQRILGVLQQIGK